MARNIFQHVVEDFEGYISSNAMIHKLALDKKNEREGDIEQKTRRRDFWYMIAHAEGARELNENGNLMCTTK